MHRRFDEIEAVDIPIDFESKAEDIDLEGSGVGLETLKGLLLVNATLWKKEAKEVSTFYQESEPGVPTRSCQDFFALQFADLGMNEVSQ